MPNAFAYLMLVLWPVITAMLYQRLDPARALIWTILAGYLILPPAQAVINLPVVPDLDKTSIPSLAALAMTVWMLRERVSMLPESGVGKGLIALFVLSPFATVLTNGDPIIFVQDQIQGMAIYDSVAAVANKAIAILPLFLARKYLATPEAMRAILVALVAAGLLYSLPMLLETRLSPVVNIWVYGFFQHDFFQTIRFGGYRPMVFLPHGLWAAFFAAMCVLAALVFFREARPEARPRWLLALGYLALVLFACKSVGPILYVAAVAPLIMFAGRKAQVMVAAVLAVVVVTYPLLRGAHLLPLDEVIRMATTFNAERGQSFEYRVINEELLLDHAAERPWFGWGGYARNLLHDPISGQTTTIGDGAWIILLTINGWLGYIAQFGLLALPLLGLAREARLQGPAVLTRPVCAVALIFAANLADLLPNATLIPFTWLMAGALLGHAEALAAARRTAPSGAPAAARRTVL